MSAQLIFTFFVLRKDSITRQDKLQEAKEKFSEHNSAARLIKVCVHAVVENNMPLTGIGNSRDVKKNRL